MGDMMDRNTPDEPTIFRARRRVPPDYRSRGVQFRLLVLVFLVMAVLVMMREARKPESWRWMWQFGHATLLDDASAPAGAAGGDQGTSGDTRFEWEADSDEASPAPVVTVPDNQVLLRDLLDDSLDESLAAAQLQGWTQVLDVVGQPQRNRLQLGLWHYRHGQPLAAAARAQWPDLLAQLTREWADYEARARQVVEADEVQLTPEQRQSAWKVLCELHIDLQAQLAALGALGDSISVPDDLTDALDQLQRVLDERAWRAVADNTVYRSAEREAWLRSWERLEALADIPTASAASRVSYVQLFSQPDTYRGRLVQVSGTAHLGYHIASHEQQFGIQGYYVVWLRAADGSNSPIVAYVTSLPAGFPALAEQTADGTALREEVTITGVFFKRWLYNSRGGANLAPLVLGRITQWTPPAAGPQRTRLGRLDAMTISYTVLSVVLVALGLAVWAYRSSRWTRRALAASVQPPSALPPFEQQSVRPSVEESLRRMRPEDE